MNAAAAAEPSGIQPSGSRPLPRSRRVRPAVPSAAPIVKWAGGKTRVLQQLRTMLPPGMGRRRLVEPFFGGGAMFFAERPERALLSDVNDSLIATYACVRDDVEALILELGHLAEGHSEDHFYEVRRRYNEEAAAPVTRAAMFLYLNRTCFNGLHRVNRKGAFNVPFGRYKNPRIVHEEGLRAASAALQHAELRNAGFEHLLESAQPGDFVYLDPPYAPMSASANFTQYAKGGFQQKDQERLRDVVAVLDRRGCRVMLSNSDVEAIHELYHGLRIARIVAPRAISCSGSTRKAVSEVVIRNY